jgi:hypothetical protein
MPTKDDALALEQLRLEQDAERLRQEAKRLELMERQIALQETQAAALATQTERTAPKENPNYQASSPFLKPSGEPLAMDLKCQVYLNTICLNETPLTRDEVDALNLIGPCDKRLVTKTDRSQALVSVIPTFDGLGRLERLTIVAPMKKEDGPQHYPPIDEFARQLVPA